MGQNTNAGIAGTQAAYPYKWPPGGGDGGGDNYFGPDAIKKDFDVRSWERIGDPVHDFDEGERGWVNKPITGFQTPSGWKTAKGKNIFHGGMFKTDLNRNIGDIEETEMDFSKIPSPLNLIRTKLRNWKEKRDVRRADEQAAKVAEEKAAADQAARTAPPTTWQGGQISPGDLRDIGDTGFHEYKDSATAAGYEGTHAQGGRVGYQGGELVEDEYMAEATPSGMMEENIEEVQGEPSREQLEVIAFEIFRLPLEELDEQQLMVVYQAAMEQEPSEEEIQFAAQEGPPEGLASLV